MPAFPKLSKEERLAMLEPPTGSVSMVLDTDTFNEIDDQFALTYALISDKIKVEAVYAAPFTNKRSTGPADGMEKSYQEILRILARLGYSAEGFAFRGSQEYLPALDEPVHSPAAEDLIDRALVPRSKPLYVLAIGAITNIASAILLKPEIIRHIVVVWLGGHPYYWDPHKLGKEFNMRQDVPAAQIIFNSGVPFVHIPCKNVAEFMLTTLPEMERYVKGRGPIGDYLYQIFEGYFKDHYARSKVLWDISTVAYLNNPDWVPTELLPAPILRDDTSYDQSDTLRHTIRVAYHVHRDPIFADLFRKLETLAK